MVSGAAVQLAPITARKEELRATRENWGDSSRSQPVESTTKQPRRELTRAYEDKRFMAGRDEGERHALGAS